MMKLSPETSTSETRTLYTTTEITRNPCFNQGTMPWAHRNVQSNPKVVAKQLMPMVYTDMPSGPRVAGQARIFAL